eukprot:jgi/Bigna1/73275/fgenesh1_pg.23_\
MFWSSVNFYTFMSTGWFTLVNIGCALNIISSIQSAHGDAKTHEHTEDFMYVSIFIQILSIFTAYAKYIYLVRILKFTLIKVPAYGIYSYCASRSSQPLFPPEQEQDPNAGKKKKSKGKLKYVNRRR